MTEEIKKEETKKVSETSKEFEEPSISIRDMLKAGVHFGHKTLRWNPKMAPYIYGEKNKLHIIDLTQTAILLKQATKIVYEVAKAHGKILFVATKKQASQTIAEEATKCGQPYVNNKWLGGMLTNWKTIKNSLKTLQDLEAQLADRENNLSKKERLMITRKKDKLERHLGGIKDMGRYPDLLFVIDTNREAIAISEARSLGIPVMAIVDTNSNPNLIDYPIPGNDDSIKAIKLYCEALSNAIAKGIKEIPENKDIITGKGKKVSEKDHKKKSEFKKYEKAPAKKKEVKAPVKTKEAKTPAKKKEEVPAKVKEAKAPVREEKEKTPAKAKEVKTPAKKEEPKAPAKKKETKAPIKKEEAKAPAKAKK